MKRRIALIGAGDLGRTLMAQLRDASDLVAHCFYDDVKAQQGTKTVDHIPVFGRISDMPAHYAEGRFDLALMAIGYNHLPFRSALFAKLKAGGIPFGRFVHPSCFVHATATVAEGAVLFPRCAIDANATIGANALLNTGCVVAHDTAIGEGTFLGPGVTLAGFIKIGAGCFIGVGTVVRDNLTLADGCRTGAGAVIVKDVPRGVLVIGVPARPIQGQ